MHTQRIEALTKARVALSQRISSYITYEYYRKVQIKKNRFNSYNKSIVKNISKLILDNSYQKDAYIDKQNNLYLLVEIKKSSKLQEILQDDLKTNNVTARLKKSKFDINKLLKSRCYPKDQLLKIDTKYPLYNNKPIWFYRPDIEGIASIGIAEKDATSTIESQTKTALTIAKASLSKRKHIMINSIYQLSTIFIHKQDIQSDRQSTKTKSKTQLKNIYLKDIWIDPSSCELYVWVSERTL